ncbi:MAG: hypothetical protein EXR99_02685 [Gemmataceae bacterium]|nr:hypothetical protein [Gemmataceae bacterium]
MARTLTLLFRRDPSRDRHEEKIPFEGYQIMWPDGLPAQVAVDALCKHGQRLLGLGKYLKDCSEKLIDLKFFPLVSREDNLTRLPGHRIRRFFVQRSGNQGRIHFMDGTPTTVVAEIGRDEADVINWLGIPNLGEGELQWFDLGATLSEADFTEKKKVRKVGREGKYGVYSSTPWDKIFSQSSVS